MSTGKIVLVLTATFISNSAYAVIAPFLPKEFKNAGVSGDSIGFMFAIYSVAVIFASPVVGKYIERIGRACMISSGLLVMGLAFSCFGFVPFIKSEGAIIFVGFLLRFL